MKDLTDALDAAIKQSYLDGYDKGWADGFVSRGESPAKNLLFSIKVEKFKCTGCTGTFDNQVDAMKHSCKDYQ